jgi:hypothetical protein
LAIKVRRQSSDFVMNARCAVVSEHLGRRNSKPRNRILRIVKTSGSRRKIHLLTAECAGLRRMRCLDIFFSQQRLKPRFLPADTALIVLGKQRRFRLYSTPRFPEDHARRIRRAVDGCPH